MQELKIILMCNSLRIFRDICCLRENVQAYGQGHTFVENQIHDMTFSFFSDELEHKSKTEKRFRPESFLEPYQFSDLGIWWIFISARIFINKNTPPNLVSITRGVRDNCRMSAYSAVSGPGRSGRSSSLRLGNLANPSSLRIFQMDAALRLTPSCFKAK